MSIFLVLHVMDTFNLCTDGKVSSTISTVFLLLSNITTSGFKTIIFKLGGSVPPLGVRGPGISTNYLYSMLCILYKATKYVLLLMELYALILNCMYSLYHTMNNFHKQPPRAKREGIFK